MSLQEAGSKLKSFWQRPEGTTGMVVLAIIGFFGLWWLPTILAWIISLLEDAIYAGILIFVTIVMAVVLTNPRFWALMWYVFQSSMRALTSLWENVDPIGILESYVSDRKKKLLTIEEKMGEVKGVRQDLKTTIEQNIDQNERDTKLAAQARTKDLVGFRELSYKVGLREKSNADYAKFIEVLDRIYTTFEKIRQACRFYITTMSAEVDEAKKRRRLTKAFAGVVKAAWSILKGDLAKREIYDETMENLAEDYASKLGMIDNLVNVSGEFISTASLQQGVFEDDMLKKLNAWTKQVDSIILSDNTVRALPEHSSVGGEIIDITPTPVREPVPVKRVEDDVYKKMLK